MVQSNSYVSLSLFRLLFKISVRPVSFPRAFIIVFVVVIIFFIFNVVVVLGIVVVVLFVFANLL